MSAPVGHRSKLSGSTSGKGIKVVATATLGTTIHTAVTGTTDPDSYDEVYLWAYNGHSGNVILSIEFGGVTVPDNLIVQTLTAKQGLILVVPGLVLQNALVVTAFADVANVIALSGFINQIRTT